ncbi:MAG: Ig-like domain-containing protein, partial [Dehalococcoidia bacterium]|nr:Ig-like domain-containing protein [Dehalococcoidia bacterium]
MSYRTRLAQVAAIAVVGVVAMGLVLVTNALAEENIPPVAVDDVAATGQDQPLTIDVLSNDSDPDGGTLSVAPGALARATIVAANPVLFWECYPVGGGTVVDRSGNGNDGAITGSVTAGDLDGDCDGANAFAFPAGAGSSVTHPAAAPSGASPRTFIVRFQAGTELAGGTPLFGTGTQGIDSGQFSISRDWDNAQLLFTGFANDLPLLLPGGTNLGDGAEHTIAVVYDGVTTVTAYVDGMAGTPATIGQLDTVGGEVRLGTAPWTDANAGDQMRQFAAFGYALDAGTIASIHAAIQSASGGQSFSDPEHGTLTNNGANVTYTPDPGFFGTDTFTYSVSDGQGGSASATVTVMVSGIAGAQPDNVTVTTGEAVTFNAVANDVIAEGLTAALTSVDDPANGTAVLLDESTIEYTPDPGFVGTDSFLYTITTSPGDETSQALVSVTVTPQNDAPSAIDDSATTTMGKDVHIDVIANDSDPDGQAVYVSPGQLARGAILRAGPLLHWECLPEGGTSTLEDTSGNSRDGAVGAGVSGGTETGDCDNGTSMTFAGADGLITLDSPGLPSGQDARSALVRYRANFTTAPADIPLFGYGQNGTPYAQFTVSRTVLGNDKLIFTSWANDLHFDLPPGANIADGQEHNIMFVYDGDLTVYAYYDGIPSGQGTLAVPLNTIDDTVMLGASPWGWRSNGDELRQFAIFPNAISQDDAYLVHAAVEAAVQNRSFTDPLHGTLVEDPDHLGFTYIPDAGYVGTDQFYYSISDGRGGGAIALVTVDVQPGVAALNDTSFTPVDTPVTIDVLANDSAQQDAVLTVTAVTQPAFGTVTTDGTTVTFTPQAGWLGIATFSYTVASDLGGDDTANVAINVGGSGNNFPPTAVDDTATTDEDTPVAINVLANDSDPDNDGLAISQGESAIPGINAYSPSLYWACLPAAGSSTLFDQSGNGVDGTLNGSVTPGTLADDCGGGTTMVFPNASAFVGRTSPGLPEGSAPRSVVLRYRTDIAAPSTVGMFGFGTNEAGNAQFSVSRNLNGNDVLSFAAWGNDAQLQLPVSIADGAEHTIAIVYDGNVTMTAYVDGVAGTPATLFAPLATVDSEVLLGKTLWGAVGDAAEMRHFAIFGTALSEADILAIHDIIESVVHEPAFTQGANGTVTQTAFNTLEYTPNEGYIGVDTFTYTVADGNGGESTATVTVTVDDVPVLPLVAEDDEATTIGTEPVTVEVLANDTSDPTGTLTVNNALQPANGTVTFDDTTVTYTANPGFVGDDTFVYSVSDGLGNTAAATVRITVEALPNLAPIAEDDAVTTAVNTPVTIDVLANDSDPDAGDILTFGSASAIETLNSFSPSLYWSCLPESGTTVPDESGNGNDGTIQGNVQAGDLVADCGGATPVFADGSALIFNSTPGSVPVGAEARTVVVRFQSALSDPADVGLFGFGTNAVGLGQFSVARTSTGNDRLWLESWGVGALLVLPPGSDIADGAEHTITVTYDGNTTVTAYLDGVAGTPATLYAPLNTVNGQVMLGQTLYGAISAGASMRHFAIYDGVLPDSAIADIDAAIEAGGVQPFTQPANGTVEIVGNAFSYTPNEDFAGDDTFTYFITDGKGGFASAVVTVTVLGNQPPHAEDDIVGTNQGQDVTIDVLANDSDPENDLLSFIPTINAISTLNAYSPALYWACLPDSGNTVPDQSGNGNDGTIQGNVAAGPLAGDCGGATPVFVDGSSLILNNLPSTLPLGAAARTIVVRYSTDLNVPANVGLFGYGKNVEPLGQFSIARTSAGNDRLTFASWGGDNILHLPAGTDLADGEEHTIAVTYDGANTITGWIDGVAGTPATIPQLNTQNDLAMLGQTLYGAVSAGASMRHFAIYNGVLDASQIAEIHAAIEAGGATAWTQPANGSVTQAGTSLVYRPNRGFVGADTFTYTVQDEDGHLATATVVVNVESVSLAPEDDTALTQQDTPVTIDVLANDAGADLEVTGTTDGANGTVTTDGTTVTYTPAAGFFGQDSFTVEVSDGIATMTTTVTVTVNGVPSGPDQAVETDAEVPVTVAIIPPVTDPEGDPLTITSAGPASHGTVTVDGDSVTYTSEAGFDGEDSFPVTVEDPDGGSVTVTVTVTVSSNEAPIVVDDTATTNSPLPVTVDVLANDSDPDGDTIQIVSAVSQINAFEPSLYWACLPESGSTVPDQSGNGNDGTIQGNVQPGEIAEDCGGATPIFADGSALIFNSTPSSIPVGAEARTAVVRFRTDLATPADVGLFGFGTNAVGLGQ